MIRIKKTINNEIINIRFTNDNDGSVKYEYGISNYISDDILIVIEIEDNKVTSAILDEIKDCIKKINICSDNIINHLPSNIDEELDSIIESYINLRFAQINKLNRLFYILENASY